MQGKIGEIMRNEAVDLLEKRMHQALDDSLVSEMLDHANRSHLLISSNVFCGCSDA
jgi:putative heme degradation protein